MDKNNLNISKIETYLYGIMDNTVSANTYAGTLPDTIKSTWTDMCLIDCDSSIRDFDAYGKGIILIWLYARPRADGSKNTAMMSKLEQRLNDVLSIASNKDYQINRRNVYTDYDSERKWHCNIVELNVIIN